MSNSQLESTDFEQLTLQFTTKMTTPNILSPRSDTQEQQSQQQQQPIVCLNSGTSVEELLARQTLKQQQSQSGATNITESVPVPSSEHVAEIVGRQGSKIKALRAKTNTYIKTPIRGEAPMFVITGRREDVLIAKREIELAAEHFSQIRASRRLGALGTSSIDTDNDPILSPKNILIAGGGNCSSSSSASISPSPTSPKPAYHDSELTNMLIMPPSVLLNGGSSRGTGLTAHHHAAPQLQPGHVSKKVTVPYQVVGLVVGPKGSTIKRIQQNTNTYIVTPSRDSQPVFEIQGLPDNVDQAKAEIENYIMMRTSTTSTSSSSSSTGAKSPKIPTTSSQQIPIQLCTNLQQTFNDYDDLSSLIDNMNQVNLWSNLITSGVTGATGASSSSASSNSSSTSSSFSSSIFSEQFLNHTTQQQQQASTTNSQCNSDFGLESLLSLSGLLSSNINNNTSSKLTSNILTPPESSASSSVASSCSSSLNSDTVSSSQLLLNNFNNLSQALLLSSLLNQQQQQQQQQSNSNDFGGFFYSNLIDSSNLNL